MQLDADESHPLQAELQGLHAAPFKKLPSLQDVHVNELASQVLQV